MARVTPARACSDTEAARRSWPPRPTACEASKQEVGLGVGLGGSLAVPTCLCLLDVVVDFGEASAVRVLGLRVEHLTGIAPCGWRQASGLVAVDVRRSSRADWERQRLSSARAISGR